MPILLLSALPPLRRISLHSHSTKLAYLEFGQPGVRPPHQVRDLNFGITQLNHNALNMTARELSIQNAIRDLNSGIYTSQRAAAKAYKIPRSTLQERLPGRRSAATAHQMEQRLTPEQEEFLVN